jgi:radical SAM superfamily enzyme YgiQ (UPF0313 family)
MPFGLCYVASALERAGYGVEVLDLCFEKHPGVRIIEAVRGGTFDCVGVSVRNIDTCATYDTLFLLDEIKREVITPLADVFSGPIVLGGSAVGINAEEILEFFDLEYAIRGDGEESMVEFVKRLERGDSPAGLPGLSWRRDGAIVEMNPPARTPDLDSLALPEVYRHIDLAPYRTFKSPIQIQTKRGCSLNCVYCTYKTIEGCRVRLRSPQAVADEIEELYRQTGYPFIEFTDSTFNIPLDHAKAVLRAVIAKDLPVQLQTMGLNPGGIDREFAQLLKTAHFKEIQVGVDAACDVTLKTMGKNYTVQDIMAVGQILQETGIPAMWYVLTGAPQETVDTARKTIENVATAVSPWDIVVLGNGIRVYKGAPLERLIKESDVKVKSKNFLYPVSFQPDSIDLLTLRDFNKRLVRKYPNFLLFDEVQRVPVVMQKIQNVLMRVFAPHKPWWKFNILMNKCLKFMGFNALRGLWDSSDRLKFRGIAGQQGN